MHKADHEARQALGRAAREYAEHGWPVVPLSYFGDHQYTCVQADCVEQTLHPVWRMWQQRASADPTVVGAWFRMLTLSVGVRTGVVFDAVSLSESVAIRLQAELVERHVPTPVAVWRERGRRIFWVERGLPWRPTLGRLDARVCGDDDWVPAPPTPTRHGPVQWAVQPAQTGWGVVRWADFHAALSAL
jgi:hypothetical protein